MASLYFSGSAKSILNLILLMMMPITKLLLIKCVEHLEDAYVTMTEQMALTHSIVYVIHYGTLMIQSGQNILDVAHHMGHSSSQITQLYVHANDKKLAEQVALIKFDATDLAIA